MRIAGILLMIAGVMMLIAFLLQLPAIYEILKFGEEKEILNKLIYDMLLLAAAIFLFYIGRKIRRSAL